jgi:hypothetical protein
MRRMRVIGPAFSAVVLASACTTANGTGGALYTAASSPAPGTRSAIAMEDSLFAQSIADREGPQATIRASFANISGSRRVQGTFHVADDAYVIVGHLDADGTLRIVFPLNPQDDGFVRGSKSYQTQEVFAGFVDSYRQRFTNSPFTSATSANSYDRGYGYMFIVASWRPMRFDRFSTDNRWDTFDLADVNSMNNPSSAINEFASLLAGENREAYTVEFARYYTTQTLYAGMAGASYSAFGTGFCSGYSPYASGLEPFGLGASPFVSGLSNGGLFWYRGTEYYDDAFGDCYRPVNSFPGFGFGGYRIAGVPQPFAPQAPAPRFFDPSNHRTPLTPKVPAPHTLPTAVADAPVTSGANLPQASPKYRERGLITADDPAPRAGRNAPRGDAVATIEDHRRPAIQNMMTHRIETSDNPGSGGGSNNWSRAQRSARDNGLNGSGGDRSTGSYRAPSSDNTRRDAPSAPRSEPVQRSAPAPQQVHTAPAPPPASTTPASSGSSSSSSGSGARPGTP